MKKYLPLLLIVASCTPQVDTGKLTADTDLLGDVIRIDRKAIEEVYPDETGLPFGINQKGDPITSQLVQGETGWSAVLLDANQFDQLKGIDFVEEAKYPAFKSHVQVRLGKRESEKVYQSITSEIRPDDHVEMQQGPDYLYQGEGPIWENDVVGFRTYFDERNGFDIFGKMTPRMMAHEISVKGNYHELLDWGMDVLKVGNSLGAGALGIYRNDTLYPIGDALEDRFEIIENGPLVASFSLVYKSPKSFPNLTIIRKISIVKGLPGYLTENQIFGANSEQLATGIVTLHSQNLLKDEADNYMVFATHDPQAELDKYLGMAVITRTEMIAGAAPESDAPVTTTYFQRPKSSRAFDYLFLAGWELQDQAYKDEAVFRERALAWGKQYVKWTK
ncbi:MAG: DUF4861 family protein [Cyclobacteriaceae bacterium]